MLTRGLAARHHFHGLSPIRSIHSAIRKSLPDLLVPTDEVATGYLYRLYEKAPAYDAGKTFFIRSLLRRSLGEPENFPIYSSRSTVLAMAQDEGILTVPTQDIRDEAALHRWLTANGLPAVLKADGTSGGEGVKIVCSRKEAVREWQRLRAPLDLPRVIKRSGFEGDPHHILPWISRRKRDVSIQRFISGQDSNIAVACWKGEVLGAVSLDVLRAWRPKGPAALVELSQDDQMLKAARAMVRRLNLSGLCGFDFMTEDGTGRAYLIEMNPRATQTCHLPYGVPRDLITSLVSALVGNPLPPLNESRKRGIISLFPLAWRSGITKEMLASTLQDVPWEEPGLVEAGFAFQDKSFYERCMQVWAKINSAADLAGENK
jgi:ATP-grasp domain